MPHTAAQHTERAPSLRTKHEDGEKRRRREAAKSPASACICCFGLTCYFFLSLGVSVVGRMTECPCAKLVEIVQRLLGETETCDVAVPSVMPPSNMRAVLAMVRSTRGSPGLFLYSLSADAAGLALRDVLPLSGRALKLTVVPKKSGGALTVTVRRIKDSAQLAFDTLATPDADADKQLEMLSAATEAAKQDVEVTRATYGWVQQYRLSLLSPHHHQQQQSRQDQKENTSMKYTQTNS